MVFVVRGFLESAYRLPNGNTSSCVLGPGNFSGDELVSWCFKKPLSDRLPPSTATLTTLNNVELFGLDSHDLRYITEHFRYKFISQKLKNTARYWSSNWRTWAAVTVQLSWRRYKQRRAEKEQRDAEREREELEGPAAAVFPELTTRSSLKISESERLKVYTAMFTSAKPQDHLE
jgi:cyclic nucleotide gated channel